MKNLLPAFADPKLKKASIRFGFKSRNSRPNTLSVLCVDCETLVRSLLHPGGEASARDQQVLPTPRSHPEDGVTEMTTVALTPRQLSTAMSFQGPKMLFIPGRERRCRDNVAGPPQHASGRPSPEVVQHPLWSTYQNRLGLLGTTLVRGSSCPAYRPRSCRRSTRPPSTRSSLSLQRHTRLGLEALTDDRRLVGE